MTKKVSKAVILTAGLGTRFLPMTKAVPKAMLPILNKPVVQYLVEEAVSAGIEEIIFVNGRGSEAIEHHFNHSHELAHDLKLRGKTELLETMEALEKQVSFAYVRQDEALGDGHAILCAKHLLHGEPFAVLFGDDIIDAPKSALQQLMEVYDTQHSPVICAERVPKERISSYGVIGIGASEGRQVKVASLVEKPKAEEAPSDLGIVGKYICTPEVLEHLEKSHASHSDGEIRLIDGFLSMLQDGQSLYAWEVEGTRYDTGNQLGLLKANLAFAMKDPQLHADLERIFEEGI